MRPVAWTEVTIARRAGGVGMPERCVYCFGDPAQDLTLRARRVDSTTKGQFTYTQLEEHLAVGVPFCAADVHRSARMQRELRGLSLAAAALGLLIGLLGCLLLLDAPLYAQIILGLCVGGVLGLLGLLLAGLFVRRLPRYRDWGAGMLGVDLVAGAQALTFRFTNPTFAATFRTRNGGER